jgi:hypothetical protein
MSAGSWKHRFSSSTRPTKPRGPAARMILSARALTSSTVSGGPCSTASLMRASKAARHLSASASRSGCSFGTGLAGRTPLLSCSEIVTYWPFSLSASVAALKAASLIHGVLPMPPFQEHRCFLSASYRIPAALTGVADHCRRCCCFVHSFSKYA